MGVERTDMDGEYNLEIYEKKQKTIHSLLAEKTRGSGGWGCQFQLPPFSHALLLSHLGRHETHFILQRGHILNGLVTILQVGGGE